jgi:chromatin segregation and condensation protein Rec8/ScpA/Scc1 (kleisin family)
MAATLVRIKVQLLLPRRRWGRELEDPGPSWCAGCWSTSTSGTRPTGWRTPRRTGPALRPRLRSAPAQAGPGRTLELELDWGDVWDALYELVERTRPPELHHVHGRVVTLEEKIELILDTLSRLSRVEFQELLRDHPDRLHAVATFLATLELARRREVAMRQSRAFRAALALPREARSHRDRDAESRMKTTQIIEALLFASDAPLSAEDLARGEEDLDPAAVERGRRRAPGRVRGAGPARSRSTRSPAATSS